MMDPESCYQDFLDALREGDLEVAAHRAQDLAGWIKHGGFVPAKISEWNLSPVTLARILAHAGVVLEHAAGDLGKEESP